MCSCGLRTATRLVPKRLSHPSLGILQLRTVAAVLFSTILAALWPQSENNDIVVIEIHNIVGLEGVANNFATLSLSGPAPTLTISTDKYMFEAPADGATSAHTGA